MRKIFFAIAFFFFGISSNGAAGELNCQVMICSNNHAFYADELNQPTATWQACRALAHRYVNQLNATSLYIIYAQWSRGPSESKCNPFYYSASYAGKVYPD